MTQNIIAICIVLLIVGYAVYRAYRKKGSDKGNCGGNCNCG